MKYYIIHNGQRHEFETLPKGTYFAVGYQDRKDKGKAYIKVYEPLGGTCLTPIFEIETGKQYKDKTREGQILEEGADMNLDFTNRASKKIKILRKINELEAFKQRAKDEKDFHMVVDLQAEIDDLEEQLEEIEEEETEY